MRWQLALARCPDIHLDLHKQHFRPANDDFANSTVVTWFIL